MDKTKKFLAALVKFGASVSPSVGANVRKLVFRLAVASILLINRDKAPDNISNPDLKCCKSIWIFTALIWFAFGWGLRSNMTGISGSRRCLGKRNAFFILLSKMYLHKLVIPQEALRPAQIQKKVPDDLF